MRRAEIQAMVAVIGLLAMAVVLIVAGAMYSDTKSVLAMAFWAGGLAAAGQALLAGLAWWGLRVARQQAELAEGPVTIGASQASASGFRMSYGDDAPSAPTSSLRQPTEVRALDVGFQRLVVALSAVGLLAIAAVIGYLLYWDLGLRQVGKAMGVPTIDPLALVLGLGAVGGYILLYNFTRKPAELRDRDWMPYGDAVNGMMVMGLPGMIAVAIATLAVWGKTRYAGEVAATIVGVLLVVQALELLVNAVRNYQGVEEFDQEPVDLGALPLVPMLTSFWVLGLKSLLAQSLGVARLEHGQERGVIARMMPRVLVALVVLAILSSTLRVVSPGEVAIRERLGYASDDDINNPLQPGLHIMFPWPIDELVRIPTGHIQRVQVGTEEKGEPIGGREVVFWSFKHGEEKEPDFITGDSPPQLLGGVVHVWWRVASPSEFYRGLSHSEFIDKNGGGAMAIRPIYEALIRDLAQQAVSKTFAMHTLETVMESDRREVEEHCRQIIQDRLDKLYTDAAGKPRSAGIQIVDLTIKEVHPPRGVGRVPTATGWALGPAAAYEEIVRAREQAETAINQAEAFATAQTNSAAGDRDRMIAEAESYRAARIEAALGDAARRQAMSDVYRSGAQGRDLVQGWLGYRALDEVLPGATKILVGHDVVAPDIWQPNSKDAMRPVGPGAASP